MVPTDIVASMYMGCKTRGSVGIQGRVGNGAEQKHSKQEMGGEECTGREGGLFVRREDYTMAAVFASEG